MLDEHSIKDWTDWVEGLNPGDQVVVRHTNTNCEDRLSTATVLKTSRTQIRLSGITPDRFRKSDGLAVGYNVYRPVRILLTTPELLKEVERRKQRAIVIKKISNVRWSSVSDEQLQAIAGILEGLSA